MENHLWEQTVRAGEKKNREKSHKTDEDRSLKEDP